MVYILLNSRTGGATVIGNNGKYTLGRSRGNNLLLKDWTCSRRHAVLEIKEGYATITDVDSKRGTFVNEQKISDETKLEINDKIRFGSKKCIYSFINPNYHTLVDDSVSENTKIGLQAVLSELNVTILENYLTNCTHYTTEFINLDILKRSRILDTLIDQKPIVTPKFWIDMHKNIDQTMEIPNIYRYMPKIDKALKNKGVENILKKKREKLFTNKICVFFDSDMEKRMEHLIWKCGGGTIHHNKQANFPISLTEGMVFFEAIVVTQKPPDTSLTVTFLIDKLRQLGKAVQEVSEEDLYITILKGYERNRERRETENRSEAENRIKNASPVLSDVQVNQPGTSKDSRNKQAVKKNTIQTELPNIRRWLKSPKKPNTKQNQPDTVEKQNEFDTSLSMSSDSSSEEQVQEMHKTRTSRNQEETGKKKRVGTNLGNGNASIKSTRKPGGKQRQPETVGFDTNLSMSSSSSEEQEEKLFKRTGYVKGPIAPSDPKERPKPSKIQDHRHNENRSHLDNQIIVLEDSNSEKMISKLHKRSNPSINLKRTKKITVNEQQERSSKEKNTIEDKNASKESSDVDNLRRRTKPSWFNVKSFKKRNDQGSSVVVDGNSNSRALSSKLGERLKPSTSGIKTEKCDVSGKSKQPLGRIDEASEDSSNYGTAESNVEALVQNIDLKSNRSESNRERSENVSIERKTRPRRPGNNGPCSISDDTDEANRNLQRRTKISSDKDKMSATSGISSIVPRKRLKINPLARPKRSSTPKSNEGTESTTDLQVLREMFQDVDFVAL